MYFGVSIPVFEPFLSCVPVSFSCVRNFLSLACSNFLSSVIRASLVHVPVRSCVGASLVLYTGLLRGHSSMSKEDDAELLDVADAVYDALRTVRDPEKDASLEDLNVIQENGIKVTRFNHDKFLINIEFVPTVPHCSLATLIGLCIRVKLNRSLPYPFKANISIAPGTHNTEVDVNKQINDKERVAAALENPNLSEVVEECLTERDY